MVARQPGRGNKMRSSNNIHIHDYASTRRSRGRQGYGLDMATHHTLLSVEQRYRRALFSTVSHSGITKIRRLLEMNICMKQNHRRVQ